MINLKFLNNEKTLIVQIDEEIDHYSCNKIREKIDLMVDYRKAEKIIFDFNGVNFMDSSGIGMIMGRYKNIHKNGGRAAVTGLRPTVRKIFQMSGLFKILEEYDTVDNAVQKMII